MLVLTEFRAVCEINLLCVHKGSVDTLFLVSHVGHMYTYPVFPALNGQFSVAFITCYL